MKFFDILGHFVDRYFTVDIDYNSEHQKLSFIKQQTFVRGNLLLISSLQIAIESEQNTECEKYIQTFLDKAIICGIIDKVELKDLQSESVATKVEYVLSKISEAFSEHSSK